MESYSKTLNEIVEFLFNLETERMKILFGKSQHFSDWLLNFNEGAIQHKVNILFFNFIQYLIFFLKFSKNVIIIKYNFLSKLYIKKSI